jgi:hypothetical protein
MSRGPRQLCAAFTVLAGVACTLAAGCAGDGSTSVSMGFGYGVYYGSAWMDDDDWYHGGSIDVGPPSTPPPSAGRPPGARPPSGAHPSQPIARPMPPPRPAPQPAGGGGRRR